MTKRLDAFLEGFFAETVPHKNAFPQAQRVAFRVQWLDIQGGISARHREAHSVGAGVDGGNMNRLGHFGIYRQRCARAAEGVYLVARIPSCSPMRCRSCLFTVGTLASPSNSIKECRFAITSNSRWIIAWQRMKDQYRSCERDMSRPTAQ